MNGLAQAAAPPITGPSLDNKRVGAAVIDLLVLVAVGFLLAALAGSFTTGARVVAVAWVLYYYFALELLTGQTLGKRVMGLRVAQADGSPPEMRQVAVRTVLRVVDGFGLYLVGLIVMLATGERRQRLGDLAAGTIVTTAEEDPTSEASEAPAAAPPEPYHFEEHDLAPEPYDYAVADAPEIEPEPIFEPAPPEELAPLPEELAPEPEEPRIELVPDPPPEGERPQMRIVSPIDLVMGEHDPQPGDDGPPPPQPA